MLVFCFSGKKSYIYFLNLWEILKKSEYWKESRCIVNFFTLLIIYLYTENAEILTLVSTYDGYALGLSSKGLRKTHTAILADLRQGPVPEIGHMLSG